MLLDSKLATNGKTSNLERGNEKLKRFISREQLKVHKYDEWVDIERSKVNRLDDELKELYRCHKELASYTKAANAKSSKLRSPTQAKAFELEKWEARLEGVVGKLSATKDVIRSQLSDMERLESQMGLLDKELDS